MRSKKGMAVNNTAVWIIGIIAVLFIASYMGFLNFDKGTSVKTQTLVNNVPSEYTIDLASAVAGSTSLTAVEDGNDYVVNLKSTDLNSANNTYVSGTITINKIDEQKNTDGSYFTSGLKYKPVITSKTNAIDPSSSTLIFPVNFANYLNKWEISVDGKSYAAKSDKTFPIDSVTRTASATATFNASVEDYTNLNKTAYNSGDKIEVFRIDIYETGSQDKVIGSIIYNFVKP
jgi:hypothetical protein